eukprot:1115413-Pleurochrysis_carterae.AAC.1
MGHQAPSTRGESGSGGVGERTRAVRGRPRAWAFYCRAREIEKRRDKADDLELREKVHDRVGEEVEPRRARRKKRAPPPVVVLVAQLPTSK